MSTLLSAVTAREMVYSYTELDEIIAAVSDDDLRVTKLDTVSNYVSIPNDMEKEELEDLIKRKFIDQFKFIYENSNYPNIRTPLQTAVAALEDVDSYVLFKVSKSMSSTDENIQVFYIEKASTR